MSISTITPGVLTVGSALPDPPFELLDHGKPAGFDVEWMQTIASELGLQWQLAPFRGTDFNAIFDGLAAASIDCIASGTTVTPDREKVAAFCEPYLRSGQSLVCNIEATPDLHSVDDLRGLVLAVQKGNTSEPVALRLKTEGLVADVRVYAYDGIGRMLDDLDAGKIGAIMKLAPVMHWFVRDRAKLRVVQENITDESLAVAVASGNDILRRAINEAQTRLAANGTLARLTRKWLGS
ncbi:MAG: ABC transporter substrate-binding protein [Pseudorhodoplanes sp.]